MTTIYRYTYLLSNFTGAPGYSSLYSDGTNLDEGFVKTFWGSIADLFPQGTTITYPDHYDAIDDTTGTVLTSGIALAESPTVSQQSATAYAGMAGALIEWHCGVARVAGRRVRGKMFLVPLVGSNFTNDGHVVPDVVARIQAAATALLTSVAPHLVIWSRPYAGRGAIVRTGRPTLPAKAARLGSSYPIVQASTNNIQATLRSRRQ